MIHRSKNLLSKNYYHGNSASSVSALESEFWVLQLLWDILSGEAMDEKR